jgi:hypothetical protein
MERTPTMMPGRRGISLVLLAVSLVVLMGMAALAIDLGMLQKARAEAQRAADAAALAGASAFLEDQTRAQESTLAVSRARVVADTNTMMGIKVDSLTELDVWVVYDSVKVRTRVRRASVPTWFARIFGRDAFPVGARAAAVADYAAGTTCVKPIAVPDLWDDAADLAANGGNDNHKFDPAETWLYNGAPVPDVYHPAHYAGDGSGTGLGSDLRNTYAFERDWGLQIVLRPSVSAGDPVQACPGSLQGGKCYSPGFWGLWGSNQTGTLANWILSCNMTAATVNTTVEITGGWRQALNKTVADIYDLDPSAQWNPTATDSVSGKTGSVTGSSLGHGWRRSPRVWIMAIMPPDQVPVVSSDNDTQFNNFMLFFFEGCMNENGTGPISKNCGTKDMMLGRFVGLAKGTLTGPNPGTMIRILRLVE